MGELLGLSAKVVAALAKAMLTLVAGSSVGVKTTTPSAKPVPKPKPVQSRPAPQKMNKIILVGKGGQTVVILQSSRHFPG